MGCIYVDDATLMGVCGTNTEICSLIFITF